MFPRNKSVRIRAAPNRRMIRSLERLTQKQHYTDSISETDNVINRVMQMSQYGITDDLWETRISHQYLFADNVKLNNDKLT